MSWQRLRLDHDLDQLEAGVWLATVQNQVVIGHYEWQQGWNPDGFNSIELGRISAKDVLYWQPVNIQKHPNL